MIKVCGITNLEDALLSAEAGANALGFNFYPKSPRFIKPAEAADIIRKLPEKVLSVGIVVTGCGAEKDPGTTSPFRYLNEAKIAAVQIHGAHSAHEIPELGLRTLIATSPERVSEFPNYEIVVDTSWGSGRPADWDLILSLLDRPYVLSGGLTPQNLEEALKKLRPSGVDVCSGVEQFPGKKDPVELRAFLSIARSFFNDSESNSGTKES